MRHLHFASLLLIVASLASAQTRLKTFDSLMTAAKAGQGIRAVFDYKKCKLVVDGKEEPSVDAIGGMKLDSWEYFAKGVVRNDRAYIAGSETVLISHPRYGYVHNYVKVRVFEDGAVEITARYLKPGTFEAVMDELFKTTLSDGKDLGGASFFAAK